MKDNDKFKVNKSGGYCVAIFGGGVAGAEAAFQLSRRGIHTVLFEQHALPYGKIEEGLPKWHLKLRAQEEGKIDEKLVQPLTHFVPRTKFGRDLSLSEVLSWGFSAVLLAVGAWRDRPLPVRGIDEYRGKGLYYQNEFVSSFNHQHEPDSRQPLCEIRDNAIVIGGGLASFDVLKILMLETVGTALKIKGIRSDLFTLEREGINVVLNNHGLTLSQLGLEGCTLYYRRRIIDMPLAPMPVNANPSRQEKVFLLRRRIAENFMQKYLFRMRECYIPVDKIIKDNRLEGIIFQKTRVENDRIVPVTHPYLEVHSPLVISSIGSIPEPAGEIPMENEMLSIEDPVSGKIRGFDNVFAVGNAVTGRGNIRESLVHSREITERVAENYLDWQMGKFNEYIKMQEKNMDRAVIRVTRELEKRLPLSAGHVSHIMEKIQSRQREVGYHGDYRRWILEHLPVRLEDLNSGKTGG